MHKTLPAHLFKARKLDKRIGVVVDAQIKIRPFLVTANHERSRLLATLVTAGRLTGMHRGDQPARKCERSMPFISCGRGLDDPRACQHIARN